MTEIPSTTPFLYIIVPVSYTIFQYTDISPIDEDDWGHRKCSLPVTYEAGTHNFLLKELSKHVFVLLLLKKGHCEGEWGKKTSERSVYVVQGFFWLPSVATAFAGAASNTTTTHRDCLRSV